MISVRRCIYLLYCILSRGCYVDEGSSGRVEDETLFGRTCDRETSQSERRLSIILTSGKACRLLYMFYRMFQRYRLWARNLWTVRVPRAILTERSKTIVTLLEHRIAVCAEHSKQYLRVKPEDNKIRRMAI